MFTLDCIDCPISAASRLLRDFVDPNRFRPLLYVSVSGRIVASARLWSSASPSSVVSIVAFHCFVSDFVNLNQNVIVVCNAYAMFLVVHVFVQHFAAAHACSA